MQHLSRMATRAENFRAAEERKPKRRKKKGPTGAHNAHDAHGGKRAVNRRAGRKASVVLERRTPGKRPSRKSTRRSANRSKPASTLERQHERKLNAPEARHARRSG
jgi:hypothetical protein